MKADKSLLLMRYSQFQAAAYRTHGRIALFGGTDESAKRAVAHFDKQLEVNNAIGCDRGSAISKSNIVYAKSKYDGGRNTEQSIRVDIKANPLLSNSTLYQPPPLFRPIESLVDAYRHP